jgi:hypothetical protein
LPHPNVASKSRGRKRQMMKFLKAQDPGSRCDTMPCRPLKKKVLELQRRDLAGGVVLS